MISSQAFFSVKPVNGCGPKPLSVASEETGAVE